MKIKVGDILYRPPYKYNSEISQYIVEKVAKKYIYLKDCSDPISIDSLSYECKNYSQFNYKLYTSIKEIEDEKRVVFLYNTIGKLFNSYKHSFDLETLESIAKILEV